jgi:hypothetical protein
MSVRPNHAASGVKAKRREPPSSERRASEPAGEAALRKGGRAEWLASWTAALGGVCPRRCSGDGRQRCAWLGLPALRPASRQPSLLTLRARPASAAAASK